MSKHPSISRSKPLRGVRVLVGRTRHQAGSLSSELRKLGAQVLEIPFIEIRKPRSFKPLDAALRNLAGYDWLILTSVNGVDAMWSRLKKLHLPIVGANALQGSLVNRGRAALQGRVQRFIDGGALAPEDRLRIAAIGPATRKAIEQRGLQVHVMPKEYVAESVVRSLKTRVKGKRVLLVRAKVARDVIPRELRNAGAHVDVVEAYETVVPQSSRARLRAALKDPARRPHVVTFTSSSTVRNFAELLGKALRNSLNGVLTSSIGPVTSATLHELGFPVDIAAKEFTIPGLVLAIAKRFATADRA